MRVNVSRVIGAGFGATLVMTLLAYAAPLMGMPAMDVGAMMGALFSDQPPAAGSARWWMGMALHFINGAVLFSLIYAYLLYPVLPGRPWLKGATWGFILGLLSQSLVGPMMGMGFFASRAPDPFKVVLGSLFGYLIYGAILGSVAGIQVAGVRDIVTEESERRAA